MDRRPRPPPHGAASSPSRRQDPTRGHLSCTARWATPLPSVVVPRRSNGANCPPRTLRASRWPTARHNERGRLHCPENVMDRAKRLQRRGAALWCRRARPTCPPQQRLRRLTECVASLAWLPDSYNDCCDIEFSTPGVLSSPYRCRVICICVAPLWDAQASPTRHMQCLSGAAAASVAAHRSIGQRMLGAPIYLRPRTTITTTTKGSGRALVRRPKSRRRDP